MKECGKCGFQNEDDAGFCGKCGAPCGRPGNAAAPGNPDAGAGTAVKCEKCQAENSPEAKFCGSCGAAVQGDDAWQAEWKAEGNKNLGAFPYVIAGLSFIPGIGIVFGIAAIIWGIFTARKGGPKLAFIGMCGILLSLLLFGSIYYFGLVRRTGVFADLRSKLTVTVAAGSATPAR